MSANQANESGGFGISGRIAHFFQAAQFFLLDGIRVAGHGRGASKFLIEQFGDIAFRLMHRWRYNVIRPLARNLYNKFT